MRRYVINPLSIAPLFVAGVASMGLPMSVAAFLSMNLGLGETASILVGIACAASLVGGLWLYAFHPVEVTTQ